MYICICNAVTDKAIKEAVAKGVSTFDELQNELGVGNCCGCCKQSAHEYLPQRGAGASGGFSNLVKVVSMRAE
ncbi:(2Fe-2S)-binding protein [Brackiella oedipodis]|uniref:(2Fe-2S)-binding protein n=1 Tax=Brackiella oedipodis TaxID=124225 RepID=UPI0005717D93|nr:(2Fe-2S)-binding protein [Brackiella oedipodis]